MKLIHSSKRNPCPVCNRTKDNDCRWNTESIFCHTSIDGHLTLEGWIYRGKSKDELWGCYFLKTEDKKPIREKSTTEYFYTDYNFEVLIKVQRVDDGLGSKHFYQYHWTGKNWKRGLTEEVKKKVAPYRLKELITAKARGEQIFIVEGEGVVESLRNIGIVATTLLGGSGKYKSYGDYLPALKDCDLVICPDRDEKGLNHSLEIFKDYPSAKWCYAFPDSYWWKKLPPNHGRDLADWINEGASKEDILGAVEPYRGADLSESKALSKSDLLDTINRIHKLPAVDQWFQWEELAKKTKKTKKALLELSLAMRATELPEIQTASEFCANQELETEWIFEGFLRKGRVTLLAAESKTGKSLLHYDWAFQAATGQPWGEFPTPRLPGGDPKCHKVLIVQTDEPSVECQERLIARGISELKNVDILTHFHPSHLPFLEQKIKENQYDLLIVDSLTSVQRFSNYSSSDPQYATFVYDLKDVGSRQGTAVVLIAHTNKSLESGLDKIAGSYAICAAASEILLLSKLKDNGGNDRLRVLKRLAGRSTGTESYSLELCLEDYSWLYLGRVSENNTPVSADTSATSRQRILDYLQQNAPTAYEVEDLAQRLNLNRDRARALLGDLFRRSVILRRKSELNKRSWCYYLPAIFESEKKVGKNDPNPITSHETLTGEGLQEVIGVPKISDRVPPRSDTRSEAETLGLDTVSGLVIGSSKKKPENSTSTDLNTVPQPQEYRFKCGQRIIPDLPNGAIHYGQFAHIVEFAYVENELEWYWIEFHDGDRLILADRLIKEYIEPIPPVVYDQLPLIP